MKVVQPSMWKLGVRAGAAQQWRRSPHGMSWGPARLKKRISAAKFNLPIKDMPQIGPGNSRHKHTPGALLVPETPESIVASPAFFMGGIVSNYRL